MEREDISRVVNTVVERVLRRLEDTTHGDLPTAADDRMYAERLTRLRQAIEQGAGRLSPQALPLDPCGDFAPLIEQTLLRPDARENEVLALCRDAVERGNAAVCLDLEWAEVAAGALKDSDVRLCVSVGFPAGGISTEAKSAEIRRALSLGADEVDVVVNLAALRATDYGGMSKDLQAAVQAAQGRTVKAVIEATGLSNEQRIAAATLAKAAGACCIKSSTGFGPDPVTVGDVAFMRAALAGVPPPDPSSRPEWPARVGAVVSVSVSHTKAL